MLRQCNRSTRCLAIKWLVGRWAGELYDVSEAGARATRATESRSAMTFFAFELRHLGLLFRGQQLVDGGLRLGMGQSFLRCERPDSGGGLLHRSFVIRMDRRSQRGVGGLHAG